MIFDSFLHIFFELDFCIDLSLFFHEFRHPLHPNYHVFTAVLQLKSRFGNLRTNNGFHMFFIWFYHVRGSILAYFFLFFSTVIVAQLSYAFVGAFRCQINSKNDMKMTKLSNKGLPAPSKFHTFLQKVVLETPRLHLASVGHAIWLHLWRYGTVLGTIGSIWFSLDAVLVSFLWILGIFLFICSWFLQSFLAAF